MFLWFNIVLGLSKIAVHWRNDGNEGGRGDWKETGVLQGDAICFVNIPCVGMW